MNEGQEGQGQPAEGGGKETLEEVVEYAKVGLAPLKDDPRARDHWFDEVKDGFDTLWCAVARLELIVHHGMSSKDVGGPVLVSKKERKKVAKQLRKCCPGVEDDPVVLAKLYVKKPPPGAKPWG